jgi:RNA polymerase-interacting CarD/CdnL/TRCF family regulator
MEKYCRNSEIIDGALDDNLVMMHIGKGKYFGLNPVGKRIWEILEQPKRFEEITDILQAEFEVTPEQCKTDVQEFLDKMEKTDIIKKA